MNRITNLFQNKQKNIINIYCTAGFPSLNSTVEVIDALEQNGADIVEIGMPYSDPLADGPVIQHSNTVALQNGMSIATLFAQLTNLRKTNNIPVVLMGYLNPVLQYGIEKFCAAAEAAGVDGVILPDLPMYEYNSLYKELFQRHHLHFIFLITPETSDVRIREIDKLSTGFIYAVSSSSTTGNNKAIEKQEDYFTKLQSMDLRNPVLIGFGIKDSQTFRAACKHSNGAVIGSAYIKALEKNTAVQAVTKEFLNSIRQ